MAKESSGAKCGNLALTPSFDGVVDCIFVFPTSDPGIFALKVLRLPCFGI